VGGVRHVAPAPGWDAGWLRYPVLLDGPAEQVLTPAHRAGGVMRGYPLALADLGGFGGRCLNPRERFVGARVLAERLVTLPVHRFVRRTEAFPFPRLNGVAA
jgi:hypothetical protein